MAHHHYGNPPRPQPTSYSCVLLTGIKASLQVPNVQIGSGRLRPVACHNYGKALRPPVPSHDFLPRLSRKEIFCLKFVLIVLAHHYQSNFQATVNLLHHWWTSAGGPSLLRNFLPASVCSSTFCGRPLSLAVTK